MLDAAYFLAKAEQCYRLSQAPNLDATVVAELKDMGHDFMAKAVYIDTIRTKAAS
jgi:hypothetical protein